MKYILHKHKLILIVYATLPRKTFSGYYKEEIFLSFSASLTTSGEEFEYAKQCSLSAFTCSNSTKETPEQCVKSVQN